MTEQQIQQLLDTTRFTSCKEQDKAKQMLSEAFPRTKFSFYEDWHTSSMPKMDASAIWLILHQETELYKLLEKVSEASEMPIEKIRSKSRKVDVIAARVLFAKEAQKMGRRHEDIGMYINLSRPTVTYLLGKNYQPHEYYLQYEKRFKNQ
jgi:hypothetical protein